MVYSIDIICEVFLDFLEEYDAVSAFIVNLNKNNHSDVTGIYTYVKKYKEQPFNLIYHAFTWHESPEKRSYWEKLHQIWEICCMERLAGKTLKYKSIW